CGCAGRWAVPGGARAAGRRLRTGHSGAIDANPAAVGENDVDRLLATLAHDEGPHLQCAVEQARVTEGCVRHVVIERPIGGNGDPVSGRTFTPDQAFRAFEAAVEIVVFEHDPTRAPAAGRGALLAVDAL